VLAYLAAENAYWERCTAAGKPFENALYEEIISRVKQDDSSVPYRMHGYWYHTRFAPGQEHPIFGRRKGSLEAPEDVMLDANLLAVGTTTIDRRHGISPDSEWLAFCKTVGRRQYTLRFKNLRTGEILDTAISDVESDLAWANDNRTFLYVAKIRDLARPLRQKARAGPRPRHDTLAFEQTEQEFLHGVSKSKSERFIFIHMESTVSSEWQYAHADDPALEFRTFLPHERDHEYQLEHLGGVFIVQNQLAGQEFSADAGADRPERRARRWRDVVPIATIPSSRTSTYSTDSSPCRSAAAASPKSPSHPGRPAARCRAAQCRRRGILHRERRGCLCHVAYRSMPSSTRKSCATRIPRSPRRPPSTITTCVQERRFC